MYLYGASGHGKVVKEVAEACQRKVEGFIDDNTKLQVLQGVPVKHGLEGVDEVFISVGDNATRKCLAQSIACPITPPLIHPQTIISPSAKLGEGTVAMAGVIINAASVIGRHCIINTGATIDHECVLADYVHISPHATLCGMITVGEGAWVGAGAVVIPGIHIGAWSVIGAGSVVVEDIPDGCLAYGNPCRVVKKINQG